MGAQRITITADGGAYGLRAKKGLDLRTIGKVSTVRTTDIKFDEQHQKWYFTFLGGRLQGEQYGTTLGKMWQNEPRNPKLICAVNVHDGSGDRALGGTYLFNEYDEAVAEEIKIVQALRSIHGRDIV